MSTEETQKKAEQILKQEDSTASEDLVSLNEGADEIVTNPNLTEDGALKQEGEEIFNPSAYGGFPIEEWNRYFGAVQDKRQARAASLARNINFKVRYNSASPDSPYPVFDKILELKYFPVTKKLWEIRKKDLAEIEDLQREQQVQATKLAETQESLRLRIFNRNKPRGMVTNREDPSRAALEEIQTNMKFFQEFEAGIGKKLSQIQQDSDLQAFEMYYHQTKEVYDQVMNEDLDDILRACDWKQIYGSANLALSKPSSSPNPSRGIS